MNTASKIVIIASVALFATSCVSSKKYNQLNAQLMRAEDQNARIVKTNENLQSDLDRKNNENQSLSETYNKLQGDYKRLLSDNSAEVSRMLAEIEKNQKTLAEREKSLREYESKLSSRDAALADIRRKVSDALLGFQGKGLTITQREGNVYVSMEDKLLFKSGSFDIDPQGAEAVRELARVLAQNPDINIMVEGHTDNVPYKNTSGILKDNLDLSVKRATTVTRLLLENKQIEPNRIISAGRGEYLPLAEGDSPEARQKNRRTEIILNPKISELLQIVE